MESTATRAIAIVGTGAVLPDAPNVSAFWDNIKKGRCSISEVAPDRWDPALYYDPDPAAPDKTYSKIGGWAREYEWDPVKWRLAIPPRVVEAMDDGQKWAITCTREALEDYGYPARPLDLNRTAVIIGNAMGGEHHYLTILRIYFPEYARELAESPNFAALPEAIRREITRELHQRIRKLLPEITEDTMPGELANCTAGRVANIFNFRGPNFTTDAACASAMAAFTSAVEGLIENHFDAAVTGGVDRNMGASSFVKFCKIRALSATGSRPYAEGADGFVMGEGAAIFLLKRLADAERDGDKIYALVRGLGGSSDGKGKGITAPNPVGQKICVERAWQNAGLSPATATMIEGHGTSTTVGDVVEAQSMVDVLSSFHLSRGSVALGSVKSNFGHLKGAAGAAGLLKATLALRDKVLPPSIHCEHPNPNIDFGHSPLYVNTTLRPWAATAEGVRRAGVSAFGFGGTNFHIVLEEFIPHRLNGNGKRSIAVREMLPTAVGEGKMNEKNVAASPADGCSLKTPLRGALVLGAISEAALAERLLSVQRAAEAGHAPEPAAPAESDLRAPQRLAIDYNDAADLAEKSSKALKALESDQTAVWKALRGQGIFRGHGPAPKVAFLYTGQGSQYVNMLRVLRAAEPIVAETFAEADRAMTPLLGKPLSEFIFVEEADAKAVQKAEADLRQTAITQPAVLASDMALTRLLAAYGIFPDMTMGHSLGEYGALVAAGGLSFEAALEAVSARGREMTRVSIEDNGRMAAIFAPLDDIERILKTIDGYVVIANINSTRQAVIGGASKPVEQAMEAFLKAGFNAVALPVSHAFHTSIVAPASAPLRRMLQRLPLQPPLLPIVANVDGEFYPTGPQVVPQMSDILGRQMASPVQFVKGLHTMYSAGARVFVEVGPKKALQGFAEDVLGDREGVVALFCNHPKFGDIAAFNQALCGLYAAGLGRGMEEALRDTTTRSVTSMPVPAPLAIPQSIRPAYLPPGVVKARIAPTNGDRDAALGRLFAEVLDRGWQIFHGENAAPTTAPVTITGAALGLPGTERIFDDANVARILRGDQFIDVIPMRIRRGMLDKHITRLVKNDNGGPVFETITNVADVIKLAARGGAFDLEKDFGVPAERVAALDHGASLAIAAGIDALRDAGIPLAMRYKTTSRGTQLPDRWGLPEALRDDTGVIFASAYPGLDSYTKELSSYYTDCARRDELAMLKSLRDRVMGSDGESLIGRELDRRIDELRVAIEKEPYVLDRRFLFKIMSMAHSQFAELIGARGPNTQVNSACASTTQATTLAEDWIRMGRCRRVIVISADDITSDNVLDWFGAAYLSSGAAATGEVVEETALPFDRRRNGLILGMGAAALVVEGADSARERSLRPICEVLATKTLNSAFHRTRLDVQHISQVMEGLIAGAEACRGITRRQIAPQMVFVSHETYTPARGGSAAAEIHALRRVFGEAVDSIVIANTKGLTGHAMGAGIEDVLAVKALETGWVPPVANFKEVDPDLGPLNLSKGGIYPVEYALRLGAGFGSQISMSLLHRLGTKDELRPGPNALGYAYRIIDKAAWNEWLNRVTGYSAAELEVVQRTLRVRDRRPAAQVGETAEAARLAPAPIPVPEVQRPAAQETAPPRPAPPTEVVKPSVAAQVAPPVPSSAPSAPLPKPTVVDDPVKERVLTLVAEKTGYPVDMLDLDLDLEADLGVDTVKQAEVFASVRETYGVVRDDTLKLREFPTLGDVIRFVYAKRPDLVGVTPTQPTSVEQSSPTADSAATPPTASDPIRERVLEIVTEKTGYPKEMLDLDLDLEADLGIDTVKQAEMFASVRAEYHIPREEALKLRDFPTLAHVIRFAREKQAGPVGVPASGPPPAKEEQEPSVVQPAAPAPLASTGVVRAVAASFEAANNIPRRVPVPTLRPPLNLCKPTGVTLGPGQRVVIMPDKAGVGEALTRRLEMLGVDTLRLDNAMDSEGLADRLKAWLSAGPIAGVYWLPALDPEDSFRGMDLTIWREALRVRVKNLYTTMRALYDHIRENGTFLMSATRLGGQHGYDQNGAVAPLGGAVVGFTKAYKWERIDVLVKAVDFETECHAAEVAENLIEETLRDPGAVEIGYKWGQRWTVGLEEQPATDGQPGLVLDKDTVFLITGAAGSIVSAITADLAAASGGTFYLLDLVPEPDPNNPDLKRFVNDREGLRRGLFDRLLARGQRATPAMVEKELAALERAHAAQSALDAVRAAGGTAHYFNVNLLDTAAVARVVNRVRERSGRINVLLHAAGMERSHLLSEKDPVEFDLVFDVKSDGWFNLLHAIGDMPLGATVAFSSISGRFGNRGQADYSAANDLLCKMTSNLRTTRPVTRSIAIDWTAWGGIGMASRGSIPKMMERAGIDMLAPEAGIPLIRRELTVGGTRGEIVVGERLGILLNEWDSAGGLDQKAVTSAHKERLLGPMMGEIAKVGLYEGLTIETTLDPKIQPFLYDHQIGGTPVLPGVMGIEAFAEAARWLLPGWHIEAIEEVDFLAPFKFYRNEPRTLTIQSRCHPQGDALIADCRLIGSRVRPNQKEPQVTTHFRARVRLTKHVPALRTTDAPPPQPAGPLMPAADIYRIYFHGPAYQVLERAWRDGNRIVGRMAKTLPSNHCPAERPTLVAPRLIELCFQTAGLWEMSVHGRLGLPQHIQQCCVWGAPDLAERQFYALVSPRPEEESFDAEVVDAAGNRYVQLSGYRTAALSNRVDAEPLKALKAAA